MDSEIYQTLQRQQGFKNLVLRIERVVEEEQDVWVVYETLDQLEHFVTLTDLLWISQFDPQKVIKTYDFTHSHLYSLLKQSKTNGKA